MKTKLIIEAYDIKDIEKIKQAIEILGANSSFEMSVSINTSGENRKAQTQSLPFLSKLKRTY